MLWWPKMEPLALTATQVGTAFPLSLSLDGDGRIESISDGLRAALPALETGVALDVAFAMPGATLPAPPAALALRHRASGQRLAGVLVEQGAQRRFLAVALDTPGAAVDELASQQETLLELFRRDNRDFDATVQDLLRENGRKLGIARCSLWSLQHDGTTIRCEAIIDQNDPTAKGGTEIPESYAPNYFTALRSGEIIPAHDAYKDPRTSEFGSGYLQQHGISALLDVPIYVGGLLIGVLCHEHIGATPRTFSMSEQHFAISIGQLLSLAFEAQRRGAAELALRKSEARLRAIIENALDAVITTDAEGIIEEWNPQAEALFGWSAEEAIGRPVIGTIMPLPQDPPARTPLLAALEASANQARRRVELTVQARDGRTFLAEAAMSPVEVGDRHVMSAFVRDITERKRLEEELRHQAFHDALTGLPNRAFFQKLINRELALQARDQSHQFALLFIDLDGFKLVNDSLGHDAGDALLIEIARRLTNCMRTTDVAARLGGDEFTILASQLVSQDDAVTLAERISDSMRQPFALGSHEIVPSGSIGILLSNPAYDTADQMMRDADAAMYRAKERGKARYEIFDRDIHKQNMERLEIENDLRHAIDRKQLRLHYQPIIDLKTGKIAGVEALLRWQRRPNELVMPNEFVKVAEETRIINRIGRWIFEESVPVVADWNRRLGQSLVLSVNVARPQFFQLDLPQFVEELVTRSGLDPKHLRIELSEKVLLKDPGVVSEALRRLPGTTCIDDFGTGLSSLSTLPDLHVQSIKIDRAFVVRLDQYQELVRAIAALAHSLGMEVMVEGVEDESLRDRLRDLGCDLAQGYWYSRALPQDELEALLIKQI